MDTPLALAVCCLDEVAAPVGQERLARGGASRRGLGAGGRGRGNAGGRSPGSETAGIRSRSADEGDAGGAGGSAGLSGSSSSLGGRLSGRSSSLSGGALCALAVAGSLGLGSALEK